MKITQYEKDILKVLLEKKGWLNTTNISKLTKMSWNTSAKYLTIMYERGWLDKKYNYYNANV